jgi:hypothetical protein
MGRPTTATQLPVAPFDSNRNSVSIGDVLRHCFGKRLDMWTQSDKNRVAACLISLGWEWHRVGPTRAVYTGRCEL